MTNQRNSLEIVGDFLTWFYHEQPDETKAATRALEVAADNLMYRWEVAEAFRDLLSLELPIGTFKNLVERMANRYVKDDDEAIEFLRRVYRDNDFDDAVNLEEI